LQVNGPAGMMSAGGGTSNNIQLTPGAITTEDVALAASNQFALFIASTLKGNAELFDDTFSIWLVSNAKTYNLFLGNKFQPHLQRAFGTYSIAYRDATPAAAGAVVPPAPGSAGVEGK